MRTTCAKCGRPKKDSTFPYCSVCRRRYYLEGPGNGIRKNGPQMAFRIISSPDDGWPCGASLDSINAHETARLGHFTPGTVLEWHTPYAIKTVEVIGGVGHGQSFKVIKKEEL